MTTKIATCCYCGSKTMLKLTARSGHELACGRCGAPLHEMKALPVGRDTARKAVKRSPPKPAKRRQYADDDRPRRRKKRRKPMWSRALEEAFDFVEDIFD